MVFFEYCEILNHSYEILSHSYDVVHHLYENIKRDSHNYEKLFLKMIKIGKTRYDLFNWFKFFFHLAEMSLCSLFYLVFIFCVLKLKAIKHFYHQQQTLWFTFSLQAWTATRLLNKTFSLLDCIQIQELGMPNGTYTSLKPRSKDNGVLFEGGLSLLRNVLSPSVGWWY